MASTCCRVSLNLSARKFSSTAAAHEAVRVSLVPCETGAEVHILPTAEDAATEGAAEAGA